MSGISDIKDEDMRKIIVAFLTLGFLIHGNIAKADENPNLKSETLALILAVDPIPGDALFYAGKPIQGTLDLLVGSAGAYLTYRVIDELSGCDNSTSDGTCGVGAVVGFPLIMGGVAIYALSLVYDAAGYGAIKVRNKEIRERKSALSSIQPMISVTDKSTFVGTQFRF